MSKGVSDSDVVKIRSNLKKLINNGLVTSESEMMDELDRLVVKEYEV